MNDDEDNTCTWCGNLIGNDGGWMTQNLAGWFCCKGCAYRDSRANGWISDAKHAQNIAEGWVEGAL
ncbi:hypothetical protein [Mycobacteroides abscessus]|uniref:hypothetical protein n=1 Tax=Mycobacteroides abscessus TaxID=36809 RepID=UPI0009A588E0|nr:hypothetical protein [Mycobacteroides abscessus]SLE83916.1 Uncharacterised protein [Mycobacteroides abscessus subsp. massiliense]